MPRRSGRGGFPALTTSTHCGRSGIRNRHGSGAPTAAVNLRGLAVAQTPQGTACGFALLAPHDYSSSRVGRPVLTIRHSLVLLLFGSERFPLKPVTAARRPNLGS